MARKPHYVETSRPGRFRQALRAWQARHDQRPQKIAAPSPYDGFSAPPRAVLALLAAFAVFMLIASLV
jgi:hypothetical protein